MSVEYSSAGPDAGAIPVAQGDRGKSELSNRCASQRACDVGLGERIASATGGGMLLMSGLRMLGRRPLSGLLLSSLGGVLVHRGVTGRCQMYRAAGAAADPAGLSHPLSREIEIRETVRIDRPARELYERWRDFESLPGILEHVEHVEPLDERHFIWHLRAGPDKCVQSPVVLLEERPGERMSWISTDGDVEHRGSIAFEPAAGERGTILRLSLRYRPPGGAIGVLIARMFGRDPAQQVRADMARFKQLMEAGEIATNAGTSARQGARGGPQAREPEPQPAMASADVSVNEASEQSFPASDPPGWSPGHP